MGTVLVPCSKKDAFVTNHPRVQPILRTMVAVGWREVVFFFNRKAYGILPFQLDRGGSLAQAQSGNPFMGLSLFSSPPSGRVCRV